MKEIEVNNVTKIFTDRNDKTIALKDIRFTVEKGEFVSIVGKTGSGKSTLLKILARIHRKYEGDVFIRGINLKNASEQIGYVPQNPSLLPWKTVEENVLLPFEVKKADPDKGVVSNALKMVEMIKQKHLYPIQLSGGMQKRASLARSIAASSDILLLDEPFGSLDEITQDNLAKSLIGIWKKQKLTIIMVTHNISKAILCSSRVLCLKDHCICKDVRIDKKDGQDFEKICKRVKETL